MEISPKYQMKLISQIETIIWQEFVSYKNVKNYIKKWHRSNSGDFNDHWENFRIYENNKSEINLNETLHNIDSETIVKIAIDLGIETPNFIPAIPLIKNILKNSYAKAFDSFQKALKQIEEEPDLAVGSANSTLESIIKYILENDNITTKFDNKDTLYDLTQSILKEFLLFPDKGIMSEIRNIGSGLLKISQNIEKLRSEKTTFHGKAKKDYILEDPLYAYYIVNAVSTIGLFLISFYEKKYNNVNLYIQGAGEQELKVNPEDSPF